MGLLAVARTVAGGRAAWLLLASLGVDLSACGSDEPETRELRDVGLFCMESTDGEHLIFHVGTGNQCLSACDENIIACSATLEGTRIELQTLLQMRDIPGIEVCPASCESAAGSCEQQVPAPGTYQLGFASRFDTATVPLEGCRPLFGAHEREAIGPVLPSPFPSGPGRMEPVPEFEAGLD